MLLSDFVAVLWRAGPFAGVTEAISHLAAMCGLPSTSRDRLHASPASGRTGRKVKKARPPTIRQKLIELLCKFPWEQKTFPRRNMRTGLPSRGSSARPKELKEEKCGCRRCTFDVKYLRDQLLALTNRVSGNENIAESPEYLAEAVAVCEKH